jgi:putative peptidoglycan lipid II flippase
VKVLLRRMGPGIVGAGATQLNLAVDVIIASLLPAGTVSVLYYADRVNQLPLGVIGSAVGTALLPMLSRQVRGGEQGMAIATLNRAVEFSVVLALPATLALAVAAKPIMAVLFGRGAFDPVSVAHSAEALAAYAVGLPAYVLAKVFAPGFFARGDTATPVKVGLAAVALNLVLNLALMRPFSFVAPALATSLAALFNAGCLAILLARRGHFRADRRLLDRLPRIVAAAVAMAVLLYAIPYLGVAGKPGLVLLVAGGLLTYGVAGLAGGAFDIPARLKIPLWTPRRPTP